MFKLALIQMAVEQGNSAVNLSCAVEMVTQAAANGARMALLPEAFDFGWTWPVGNELATAIPHGRTCHELARAAKKNDIYRCAGLIENADGRIFNSAVIINRKGEVVLHHRKINELEIAREYYQRGEGLGVCQSELGTLGLMICADGFAKDRVISRTLGYMGADIILSPCAWAVDGDHDNDKEPYGQLWLDSYIPVAKEFGVWIVGVSNVGPITAGPWQGKKCIGCSLAISPDGKVAAHGPYGKDAQTILYVDVVK